MCLKTAAFINPSDSRLGDAKIRGGGALNVSAARRKRRGDDVAKTLINDYQYSCGSRQQGGQSTKQNTKNSVDLKILLTNCWKV